MKPRVWNIWKCTKERYDDMLGMVPPIIQTPKGFVVGEGQNERRCEQTWKLDVTFVAFFEKDGEYYESDP